MGFKVYYGDATRLDLLKSAGADDAKILIAAIDSPETNQELINTVQKTFPGLQIMARAKSRIDAYDLLDMGLKDIYRESLHTSVKLAVDVLVKLGTEIILQHGRDRNFLSMMKRHLLRWLSTGTI